MSDLHALILGQCTPLHNPDAEGTLFWLNLTHTRADLYRAAIVGIAAASRQFTDSYSGRCQAKPRAGRQRRR